MLIPLKEMYLGETAEIGAIGDSLDLKRLASMGVREGKLVDLLFYDPIVTKKVVVGVDNSRIAFPVFIAAQILVRPLKSYFETLKNLAHYDQLTGCLNRHAARSLLREEMDKFATRRLPLAVLLADIDHFKGINDTFGHPAGDEVLRGFAHLAREVLRRSDVICRWGGEEFLILLRGTDLREATRIAERLREKVAETIFPPLPSGRAVTVSVGGCSLPPFLAPEQLISQADALLYRAKREGRNRVILC